MPLAKRGSETWQRWHLQLEVDEARVRKSGEHIRECWYAETLQLDLIEIAHRTLIPVRASQGSVVDHDWHPVT